MTSNSYVSLSVSSSKNVGLTGCGVGLMGSTPGNFSSTAVVVSNRSNIDSTRRLTVMVPEALLSLVLEIFSSPSLSVQCDGFDVLIVPLQTLHRNLVSQSSFNFGDHLYLIDKYSAIAGDRVDKFRQDSVLWRS